MPLKPGSAPKSNYGRSCASCVKAKCRCVLRAGNDICERCHRLQKNCAPARSIRYQPENGDRDSSSNVAALERKLDQVVALIQAQQHPNEISPIPTAEFGTVDINNISSSMGISHAMSSSNVPSELPAILNSFPPSIAAPKPSRSDTILPCAGEPSHSEAVEYFSIFQRKMIRFFPVVYVPHGMSSHQLREKRPFLWLCIMTVACTSTSQQIALGASVKKIVAKDIIFSSEKKLDYLLGLLVFIAWGHYQSCWMVFLTDLIQISMSLAFELGLNKSPRRSRGAVCFKEATASKPIHMRPTTPTQRQKTMEERRAVLGCYLVSSMAAISLKRLDGLQWTTDMDKSLKLLSDEPEWPGDRILAIQVKAQLLMTRPDRSYCTWPFGDSLYAASFQPPESHVDLLLSQVQVLGAEIRDQALGIEVTSRISCIKLLLNESLLCENDESFFASGINRIERCSACIDSIKSWFDNFLGMPADELVGFSFMDMCSLAYNLLVLFRLTTADNSSTEMTIIRSKVDIIYIVRMLAEMYARVAETCRLVEDHGEIDFFSDSARIFKCMTQLWEQEINRIELANQDDSLLGECVDSAILPSDFVMDLDGTSFFMNMLSSSM